MSDANGFSAPLAAFYDATHDYGDVGDESFYVDAAVAADGPVLEGACGSGRLYLELLRKGVVADSFDEWHERGEFEYDGESLVGWTRATIEDEVAQTYRTEQEIHTPDGEVVARGEFVLSHLPPQQIELLARQSPFAEWSATSDFDGDPLEDGADVQVRELTK